MAENVLAYRSASGPATAALDGSERLAPGLRAAVRVRPGAAPVVVASGELDISSAVAFADLVTEVIVRHGPDVVIDATGISFCDARGLGALVRCANEAGRAGGRVTLSDPSPRLLRLVRIVHLDHLL